MDRKACPAAGSGASADRFLQLIKSFFVAGGNYFPKQVDHLFHQSYRITYERFVRDIFGRFSGLGYGH
jgi:hypothetical protein